MAQPSSELTDKIAKVVKAQQKVMAQGKALSEEIKKEKERLARED